MKERTSVTLHGVFQVRIASTFSGCIRIPLRPMMRRRYVVSVQWNWHFSGFRYSPALDGRDSTWRTWVMCSSSVSEYTMVLSRKAEQKRSRYGDRVSLMYAWKVAGALVKLKGITRLSNSPYQVLKAVFHSLPSAIRIILYAPLMSSLVKYFALLSCIRVSWINGRGYLFLMVFSFRSR